MTGPIDKAYVEIEPKFDNFASETESGVNAALRGIERVADRVVESIEHAFEGLADVVERQFEEMRVQADRNLDALAATVEHVGDQIGHDINQGTESAERGFAELARSADRQMDRVERRVASAGASLHTKLGGLGAGIFVGGAATALAGGLAAGLSALTAFGLKSAASLEQVQIQFQSLTGSVEQGNKVFTDLQKFAAQTPFEFPDVAKAGARFLAFNDAVGLSDAQLQDFLTTTGNVISVTGGGATALNSVTLAMGQIASSGKLTLENLNQISEALPGFSGVAAIASATGLTTAQVMDKISKGEIDATTGIQALLKGMQQFPGAAGAMEKQAQTLLGVFSTFKDTISQALANSFTPVIPAIKDSLIQITPILGDALNQIVPVLGQALAGLLPLIGNLVKEIGPILAPIIEGLGKGLAAAAPAADALLNALAPIAEALSPLLVLAGQIVGVLGTALAPILKIIGDTINSTVIPVVSALSGVFFALTPSLTQLGQTLATTLQPLFQAMGPLALEFANALIPLTPDLIDLTQASIQLLVAMTPLIDAFVQILPLLNTFPSVGAPIVAVLIQITTALFHLPEAIGSAVSGFISFFTNVGAAIGNWINGVIAFFQALPGKIGAAIQALPGILVNLANQAFTNFFFAIGFGVGKIIGFLAGLPGQIANIFSNAWGQAKALTSSGINAVVSFVSALPGRIISLVSSAWNSAVALFRGGVANSVSAVSALPGQIAGILGRLPGIVANAASGAASWLVSAGRNIILGLVNGINGAIGDAVAAAKRAVSAAVAGAKAALGISSPSKVFEDEVGRWIPAGVAQGIDKHANLITQSITNITPSGNSGVGAGITFAAGAISVALSGDVTQKQAYDAGRNVAQGIMDRLNDPSFTLYRRPRTV